MTGEVGPAHPSPPPGSRFEGVAVPRKRIAGNDADGWAVLDAEVDGDRVTLVGPVGHLELGRRAQVEGTWKRHPKFGLQLRADQAIPLVPTDRDEVMALLRRIPNIGRKRAAALHDVLGGETIARIDADPEGTFAALPGVNARKAAAAAEAWRASSSSRELVALLAPERLAWLLPKLENVYGGDAMARLRANPYRLVSFDGVGFSSADRIAQRLGMPVDHPGRAQAAVLHVLAEAENQGSSALPRGELARRLERLTPVEPDLHALGDLIEFDDEWIARAVTAEDEQTIAETVAALLDAGPAEGVEVPAEPPRKAKLEPAPEQWAAVQSAFANRLTLITGGPGTGKTTILTLVCAVAAEQKLDVKLVAPTGRAAVRMTEATGHEASTVHAALGWVPGMGPTHGPENPLKCELLICDESSMANNQLLAFLLGAVGEDTHVVLVGDADQLAPVGAGAPFRELIGSGLVPVCRLEHVFRQRARSMIVRAAHAIRRGQQPELQHAEGLERDLFVLPRDDEAETAQEICTLVTRRLPGYYGGVDPLRDILVMTPIHRGPLGTLELNARLRAALNPAGEPVEGTPLRIGDKVMMTARNRPDLGLMNGTVAFVSQAGHEPGFVWLEVDGRHVEVGEEDVARLVLAYATTVHKAQGQDAPVAVLVCDRSAEFMLRRELVYTAITRARRATLVIGQPQLLTSAARRPDTSRRWTLLTRRLRTAAAS